MPALSSGPSRTKSVHTSGLEVASQMLTEDSASCFLRAYNIGLLGHLARCSFRDVVAMWPSTAPNLIPHPQGLTVDLTMVVLKPLV